MESERKEIGIHEYGVLAAAEIPFEEEIQRICAGNADALCLSAGKAVFQNGAVQPLRKRGQQAAQSRLLRGGENFVFGPCPKRG